MGLEFLVVIAILLVVAVACVKYLPDPIGWIIAVVCGVLILMKVLGKF